MVTFSILPLPLAVPFALLSTWAAGSVVDCRYHKQKRSINGVLSPCQGYPHVWYPGGPPSQSADRGESPGASPSSLVLDSSGRSEDGFKTML